MITIDRNITAKIYTSDGRFSIIKGLNTQVGKQVLSIMEDKKSNVVRIEIYKGLVESNNVNDPYQIMLCQHRKNEDGNWVS